MTTRARKKYTYSDFAFKADGAFKLALFQYRQ